jgi:hypothetical protein
VRQQTLEDRAWERLVSEMAPEGWRLPHGSARHFEEPGPGGLVFQVAPRMDPVGRSRAFAGAFRDHFSW